MRNLHEFKAIMEKVMIICVRDLCQTDVNQKLKDRSRCHIPSFLRIRNRGRMANKKPLHCTENPIYVFPEMKLCKCAASILIPTFMYL
jgi:hypothetical protein